MLKWTLLAIAALAVLVAAIAIVGLLLPREHVASRSATVDASADRVFDAIAGVAAYASWRSSLSSIEILAPVNGRPRWVEVSGGDRVTLEIVEQHPPDRVVTRIADPDLPFGGTWTFQLTPEGTGTRVTITEHGEVRNPMFRALARFVFGYTASMDAYLGDLGARFTRP